MSNSKQSQDTPTYEELLKQNSQLRTLNEEIEEKLIHTQKQKGATEKISKSGSWELDLKTNKHFWSENYCLLLGYDNKIDTPDEKLFLSHVYHEDLERVKAAMQESISDRIQLELEFRYVPLDGSIRYAKSRAELILDHQNNIANIFGIFQDVTETKESEAKYGNIIEFSPQGIHLYKLTPEEKLIFNGYNKSAEAILGIELEKNMGKTIEEAFPALIDTEIPSEYRKVAKTGKQFFTNQIDYDDNQIKGAYEVRAYRVSQNNIAINFSDITERLRKEEELKDSQQRFKSLFNNIEEGVALHKMIFDGDNNPIDFIWVDVNPKYEELTQLKKDEIVGKMGKEVIPNIEQKWYDMYGRVATTGKPESTVDHSDYLNTYWEVKAFRPIEGHFAVAMTDVTDKVNAENQLIKAKEKAEESDRLKSAFLASMSHEIRTPMNGIVGFTELLREPDITEKEQNNYLNVIERSGERLLGLINNLIDLSKLEAGQVFTKKSTVLINDVFLYTYNFFQPELKEKELEIIICQESLDKNIKIKTDRHFLEAILLNLVKNSIKYTEAGHIIIGYEVDKKEVVISIRDTGIGIPKEKQEDVFNRFVQVDSNLTKNLQGAGLGLSICKGYVELLGGRIWVESEVGVGSTFYFTLPIQ